MQISDRGQLLDGIMKKLKILVLNGHPAESSISKQLSQAYYDEAVAKGHDVRLINLRDLSFDLDYGFGGFKESKPLESDLEEFIKALKWCDHFTLATPMWWGGVPAKLKGLFDRALLPGIAFDSRGGGLPKPLLTGRSGHVLITSDSPWWYFRFFIHRALYWQLKVQILQFIGIKPLTFRHFVQASHPQPKQVEGWLSECRKLARSLS
jgi:putative NADPH-quinone reductase